MKLPPGVKSKDFADAIRQFEEAVGKQWVFTSDEDVALYRDAYSPFWGEEEERIASAAVAPDGVEQVQKVVRVANALKIPIYPISTGKNLGYGGSAPNLSGSVVLDLKRMNRVLEVSERNAYALVEPGVSYFDLYRYIQEKGYKVWVDVPDPGWGSPIGNALDHGGGYLASQFRNHFDSHCGMEVVLANGDLLRTGMGAMPAAKDLAGLQIRLRPLDRRPVFPGQFRSRYEDGLLADAAARRIPQRNCDGARLRGHRSDGRCAHVPRKLRCFDRNARSRKPGVGWLHDASPEALK